MATSSTSSERVISPPRAEALRIMQRDAGKHFDPELLEIFCTILPPESRSELPDVAPRMGGRAEMFAA